MADSVPVNVFSRVAAVILLGFFVVACEGELTEKSFRRRAEHAYMQVNAGWTIVKREATETVFVRGDQVDRLPVGEMFTEYQSGKRGASEYFEAWIAQEEGKAAARRRTLDQAKDVVIPIIKSGAWVRIQDLGAIGPRRIQDQIRPWRHEVADDVFVVLGIPEAKLGYRFASIEEVQSAGAAKDAWLNRAIANLSTVVGRSTDGAREMKRDDGTLLVIDMPNTDGVSGLILDRDFRADILDRFGLEAVGAAAPNRNVLILFDPDEFTATKPVRARAHQLYDTQNHPGFRGLFRLEADSIGILEPANPKSTKVSE